MANCSEFLANFSDYVDRRADRRTARRLEVHLRRCGRCREVVAALRRGVGELVAAEEVVPSPFFRQRLAARLEREVRIGDPIQPTPTGLAAALLIGVALGLTLLEPLLTGGSDVPMVAEQTRTAGPFAASGLLAVRGGEPDFVPWVLPDVTLAFTHRPSLFSSHPRPSGTFALLAR